MKLIKRRFFLISLAVFPLFLWRPFRWLRTYEDKIEIGNVKHCLLHLFTDQSGARLIGNAYLAAYPDERDRTLILNDLIGPGALCGPDALRCRIEKRRTQDFLKGEVVVVDGWILAKSEARAAALTALL